MSKIGDAFQDWLDGGKDSSDNATTNPHDDRAK